MGTLLLRLRTWWETSDRTQKVVTVFGGSFLVILLAGVAYTASRPKMELLFGGLTAADQGMVIEELRNIGIATTIDAQGNVLVPSDKLPEARAKLAMNGKTPRSGSGGFTELPPWGGLNMTPSVEREKLRAGLEAELASTISAINGIDSAKVHLSMGDDAPFAIERRPPTASITVVEEPGFTISGEQAKAVAMLVARAVSGMDTKDVTVMTGRGQLVWDGLEDSGSSGLAAKRVEAQNLEAKRIERELQRKLDTAFGVGNTVATVVLTLDFDKKHVEAVENTPSEAPRVQEKNKETMKAGSKSPTGSGVAGAISNNPAAPAGNSGAGADGQAYESSQEATEFEVNTKKSSIDEAAGDVESMAINVLVDGEKVTDVASVESFLAGYLGPKSSDTAKYKATVTSAKFDRSAQAAATKAGAEASGRQRVEQILAILPVAALLVVGFLVMKSMVKVAKSQNVMVQALPDGTLVAAPGAAFPQGALGAGAGKAVALPAGGSITQAEMQQAMQTRRAVPKALSLQDDEEEYDDDEYGQGKKKRRSVSFVDTGELETIEAIREKVNVQLEQIKKLAVDRPETVAMLLKTWMLEERR
ncbi:MAG: hypothetical protein HONBIEJF_03009 [Fimbriimonadaceae bacterium]|nr:hypothetical protein [Fimbriimonadaceae bacterium]